MGPEHLMLIVGGGDPMRDRNRLKGAVSAAAAVRDLYDEIARVRESLWSEEYAMALRPLVDALADLLAADLQTSR
jgi:hypothetical protein